MCVCVCVCVCVWKRERERERERESSSSSSSSSRGRIRQTELSVLEIFFKNQKWEKFFFSSQVDTDFYRLEDGEMTA